VRAALKRLWAWLNTPMIETLEDFENRQY